MAKKKVATVLAGKKHPRYKLVRRLYELARAFNYNLHNNGGKRADTAQKKLDAIIAQWMKTPKMQCAAHDKALKRAYDEERAQRRAAERTREKARKERQRLAQKKRDKAAKAKAKRDKVKAAKAAKKAAALTPKAPHLTLVPDAAVG